MADRNGRFRTLGARMLSFGRSVMRSYENPEQDSGSKTTSSNRPSLRGGGGTPVQATWKQAATNQQMIWRQSAPPAAPGEAAYDDSDMPPADAPNRPQRRRPQPTRNPQQQPAQRRPADRPAQPPKKQSALEKRLQNILDMHTAEEDRRDEIRRKKKENINTKVNEAQQKLEDGDESAVSKLRRRGSANFDYVDTASLVTETERKDIRQQAQRDAERSQLPDRLQRQEDDDANTEAETPVVADEAAPPDAPTGSPATDIDAPTEVTGAADDLPMTTEAIQRAEQDAAEAEDDAEWWDVDGAFEPANDPIDDTYFDDDAMSAETSDMTGSPEAIQREPDEVSPSPSQAVQREPSDALDAEILEEEEDTSFSEAALPPTPDTPSPASSSGEERLPLDNAVQRAANTAPDVDMPDAIQRDDEYDDYGDDDWGDEYGDGGFGWDEGGTTETSADWNEPTSSAASQPVQRRPADDDRDRNAPDALSGRSQPTSDNVKRPQIQRTPADSIELPGDDDVANDWPNDRYAADDGIFDETHYPESNIDKPAPDRQSPTIEPDSFEAPSSDMQSIQRQFDEPTDYADDFDDYGGWADEGPWDAGTDESFDASQQEQPYAAPADSIQRQSADDDFDDDFGEDGYTYDSDDFVDMPRNTPSEASDTGKPIQRRPSAQYDDVDASQQEQPAAAPADSIQRQSADDDFDDDFGEDGYTYDSDDFVDMPRNTPSEASDAGKPIQRTPLARDDGVDADSGQPIQRVPDAGPVGDDDFDSMEFGFGISVERDKPRNASKHTKSRPAEKKSQPVQRKPETKQQPEPEKPKKSPSSRQTPAPTEPSTTPSVSQPIQRKPEPDDTYFEQVDDYYSDTSDSGVVEPTRKPDAPRSNPVQRRTEDTPDVAPSEIEAGDDVGRQNDVVADVSASPENPVQRVPDAVDTDDDAPDAVWSDRTPESSESDSIQRTPAHTVPYDEADDFEYGDFAGDDWFDQTSPDTPDPSPSSPLQRRPDEVSGFDMPGASNERQLLQRVPEDDGGYEGDVGEWDAQPESGAASTSDQPIQRVPEGDGGYDEGYEGDVGEWDTQPDSDAEFTSSQPIQRMPEDDGGYDEGYAGDVGEWDTQPDSDAGFTSGQPIQRTTTPEYGDDEPYDDFAPEPYADEFYDDGYDTYAEPVATNDARIGDTVQRVAEPISSGDLDSIFEDVYTQPQSYDDDAFNWNASDWSELPASAVPASVGSTATGAPIQRTAASVAPVPDTTLDWDAMSSAGPKRPRRAASNDIQRVPTDDTGAFSLSDFGDGIDGPVQRESVGFFDDTERFPAENSGPSLFEALNNMRWGGEGVQEAMATGDGIQRHPEDHGGFASGFDENGTDAYDAYDAFDSGFVDENGEFIQRSPDDGGAFDFGDGNQGMNLFEALNGGEFADYVPGETVQRTPEDAAAGDGSELLGMNLFEALDQMTGNADPVQRSAEPSQEKGIDLFQALARMGSSNNRGDSERVQRRPADDKNRDTTVDVRERGDMNNISRSPDDETEEFVDEVIVVPLEELAEDIFKYLRRKIRIEFERRNRH